jgi:hypothetical protein
VDSPTRYKGYLSKMSPKKGAGWQRRWFVLEDGKLMCVLYYTFTPVDAQHGTEPLDEPLTVAEIVHTCIPRSRYFKGQNAEAMFEQLDAVRPPTFDPSVPILTDCLTSQSLTVSMCLF